MLDVFIFKDDYCNQDLRVYVGPYICLSAKLNVLVVRGVIASLCEVAS